MKHIIFIIIAFFLANCVYAQCVDVDNDNYWNQSWVSCSPSPNPNTVRGNSLWLLYEFQEPQYIDATHIWNPNKNRHSILGAKDVVIDYSLDGNSWLELGNYTFPKAPETNTYNGFAGPDFNGVFLKKILITILSSYNENGCASIAEVQFNIDQTKCYGEIDECGVCNGKGEITWYKDEDGDGLGNPEIFLHACTQPIGYVDNNEDELCDSNLIWDEVYNIFDESGCTGCHGGIPLGGFSLSTYQSFSAGGNKCGSDILSGTTLVDIITTDNYDGCTGQISESMNSRVLNPISEEDLNAIQLWIDAGTPEYCTQGCSTISLNIQFDAFPAETSWDIVDEQANVVISNASYNNSFSNTQITENICLSEGCYTFTFNDAMGNGLCPYTGDLDVDETCIISGTFTAGCIVGTIGSTATPGLCGNYTLTNFDGSSLAEGGGDFGASISYDFCIGNIPVPPVFKNNESHNLKVSKSVAQISVIPNLVLDKATLSYSIETKEDIHIQIVDVTGKMMQQYTRPAKEANLVLINASNYKAGFYFVRLVSGSTTLTDKFFKF